MLFFVLDPGSEVVVSGMRHFSVLIVPLASLEWLVQIWGVEVPPTGH